MAETRASTLNSPGHVPERTPEDHSENVRPEDSVSQAGSRTSRRSQASRRSSLFSEASAARMKEEAKKAELIARTIALKKVQALDSEEHQLRQRREQLTLQEELNVVAARANVYALFEDMAQPDTTAVPR